MNENGNVGCLCSWPIIIIALILFWPVGILLIVWRATKDRKTAMRAGKLLSVLGFVSYVFAAIMVIGAAILNMLPGEENRSKARKWLPNILIGIGIVVLAFTFVSEWYAKF